MESNEVLSRLPRHLMSLVIDQPYNAYTAQDQAVWRYIMKQNVRYLPGVAHHSYLDGLSRTGISVEQIPHMYGMNRILKEIGWAAVAVDGFIPPKAFMEFQAYNVLVIAADIRPVEQVEYTPAPDIVHEAAGHAPIIANEDYAAYLRDFGAAGVKAFSSPYDDRLYEAIRHLSILKADPNSRHTEIDAAVKSLSDLEKRANGYSEMALLRNLHWWTVEYGLTGSLDNPKIYGAGLLSSIGESYNCLQPGVKKLPYSLDAMHVSFDITTQQPQLFVTPDFDTLNSVLEQYCARMAFRTGGPEGVKKAAASGEISTLEYASGLQVSGILDSFRDHDGIPVYLSFSGPVQLCFRNRELEGHGKHWHKEGFGSPVGILEGISTPPELLTGEELIQNGIREGSHAVLRFESGVEVSGRLVRRLVKEGCNLLFSFEECTVTFRDKTLFHPGWGTYDMAVGHEIVSACAGPADPDAYGFSFPVPEEKTHKISYSNEASRLHGMYGHVRKNRENREGSSALLSVFDTLRKDYPDDWLLPLEIAEILKTGNENAAWYDQVVAHLRNLAGSHESFRKLIHDGLAGLESR